MIKQWDYSYGGYDSDFIIQLLATADGGFISAGQSLSDSGRYKSENNFASGSFTYDIWILKCDANGNKLWDKTLGGTDDDFFYQCINTADGGVLVTGSTRSPLSGNITNAPRGIFDMYLVKLSSNGTIEWDKRYGGSAANSASHAIQLSDGGFLVAGSTSSPQGLDVSNVGYGAYDAWLVRLDSTGNKIWDKRYGGSEDESAIRILQHPGDGFLLVTASLSNISGVKTQNNYVTGKSDIWNVRIDTSGVIMWDKTIGSLEDDFGIDAKVTPDSNFIFTCINYANIGGDKTENTYNVDDFWVIKTDSACVHLWDHSVGGDSNEDEGCTVTILQDGSYLINGTSYSGPGFWKSQVNNGPENTWSVKIDANGNKVWDKTVLTGYSHTEIGLGIQLVDGCYILANNGDSFVGGDKTDPNFSFDYWCVKYCDSTNVPVIPCAFTVNAGSDSTFCNAHTVQLQGSTSAGAGNIGSISWQPITGLSDTTILNPVATVNATTTYVLTVTSLVDTNLVFNGDFSLGDTGFVTGYMPGQGGISGTVSNPFDYDINTNPHNSHIDFATFGDHTTGIGNMLIANGADQFNVNLWCQTVNVTPFQTYNYTAWATACNWQNPAQLQFSVNGIPVGSTLYLTSDTGTWLPFTTTWNADTNTTATICITDLSTWSAGNDFAVDDISFTGACSQSDSVTVFIQPVAIISIGNDTTVCNNDSVVIIAPTGFAQYEWQLNGAPLPFTGSSIYATQQGSYSLLAGDGSGCNAADTIQVNFRTASVSLGNDLIVCNLDSIALNAGAGFTSYNWFLNGSSIPNNSSTIYASQPGQYAVNVTDSMGCGAGDTLSVAINNPSVTLGSDIVLCNSADTIITATQGFSLYMWSLNNNLLNDTTSSINASQQGSYVVVVTDSIGCKASDTLFITLNALAVTLNNDTAICANQQTIIIATGAAGTFSWLYNNTPLPVTGDSITVNQQGNYTVNVVSTNGCTATDSFNLTVNALPQVITIDDVTICDAGSVTLTTTGANSYTWSPSTYLNSATGPGPISTPLNSIAYSVTGIDTNGCSNTDTVNISFAASPIADFDFTAYYNCLGVTVATQNKSSNATSYSWNFGDGFTSTETDLQYTYSTVNNTPLQLVAFNNQCADTLIKNVAFISPTFADSISNVFTPNGDGLNDCFVIAVPPTLKDCYSLYIHNRWGQNVFKADNDELCWDGTINNGKKADEGIYYYILKIAAHVYHGTVSLFR